MESPRKPLAGRPTDSRGQGEACAHAQQRVGRLQWRTETERVATDVVEVEGVIAKYCPGGEERGAVGAGRAQHRWTGRYRFGHHGIWRGIPQSQRSVDALLDDPRLVFEVIG